MPRRDGPENLRILKKNQLKVEVGPWSRVVGYSAIELKSWVFRISTGRDELRSLTPWDWPNIGGGVSIIWLRKTFKNRVYLLVLKNRSQKLINHSYLNNRVHLYCISICICIICTVVIDIIIAMVCNICISRERRQVFMSISRTLAQIKTKPALSRIRTQAADSISYHDKYYPKSSTHIYIYTRTQEQI